MKANEVIRIGRSRSRAPSSAASTSGCPARAAPWRTRRSGSRSWPPARPASPGRSARRRCCRTSREQQPEERARARRPACSSSTLNGSDQLSYSAARIRNTKTQRQAEHAAASCPRPSSPGTTSRSSRSPCPAGRVCCGDLLQRVERLARAVAGRRRALDLADAIQVEAHRVLGPGGLRARRRATRAGPSRPRRCARRTCRCPRARCGSSRSACSEHPPLAAEAGEVVDVGAAQERLERGVDVGDRHALLERLVLVDVGEQLRHRRREVGAHACELRALARRGQERCRRSAARNSTAAAAAVLQHHAEAAGELMPGIAGGEHREHARLRDLRELPR